MQIEQIAKMRSHFFLYRVNFSSISVLSDLKSHWALENIFVLFAAFDDFI